MFWNRIYSNTANTVIRFLSILLIPNYVSKFFVTELLANFQVDCRRFITVNRLKITQNLKLAIRIDLFLVNSHHVKIDSAIETLEFILVKELPCQKFTFFKGLDMFQFS